MRKHLRPWLRFISNDSGAPGEGGSGSGGKQEPGATSGQGENETPGEEPGEELGESGIKALQSEREARKQADKRVAELESENQALKETHQEALKTAEAATQDALKQVEASQTETLRYQVAAQFGISTKSSEGDKPSDAEMFLTGTTEEELTGQAQRLADLREASLGDGLVDPTQGGGTGKPAMDDIKPGADRLASAFDTHITSK